MYVVGMLGSIISQGVYAIVGPFQPFGGAVDIIVVQQEDGNFKSSPWYVKFGDFQGVLKRQENIVHISVNDVLADFHMILDSSGEAYFEKDPDSEEGACSMLPGGCSSLSCKQENDTETGTDGGENAQSHKNEESDSTISNSLLDLSVFSIAEGKIMTEEKQQQTQQEQDSQTVVEPQMEGEDTRETSYLRLVPRRTQSSESIKNNCVLDVSCTENMNSNHLVRSQKGGDSKDQVSFVASGDLLTDCAGLNKEDAVSETNFLLSDLTKSVRTSNDLEQLSASPDIVRLDRANNDSINPNREGMPDNTTSFSMGKSMPNNILTFSDSHTKGECTVDLEICGNRIALVADSSHVVIPSKNLQGNHKFNSRSDIDCDCDENDTLPSNESLSAGAEEATLIYSSGNDMNAYMPTLCREERDSPFWDLEQDMKQGLGDDVFSLLQSDTFLQEDDLCNENVNTVALEKEGILEGSTPGVKESKAALSTVSSPSKWRFLWPLLLRWSRIEKTSSLSNQAWLAAASVAIKSPFTEDLFQKSGYLKWQQKTKLRTYVPTSMQLGSLNLKDGPNKVTFTFSSVIGKTQVDARIYLWKWSTRIVISDVDGTITKSDVLGQVMPLVGRDWSQYGVARLFSAIKDNGYEVLFLSARAISQACLTRRFLLNLKQDGEALPEGPMCISPDGLLPSLYREVIRRTPHEFKISCLQAIRELFPKHVNPFHAGFGNHDTDKISYLKVKIPEGKVFIINPKGEVVVNQRVDCKSYTSLYGLVDEMFPPMFSHEQEEFNEWNFWKVALPDIEDEFSTNSCKAAKKPVSSKK